MTLAEMKKKLYIAKGCEGLYRTKINDYKRKLKSLETESDNIEKAQILLQNVAQETQSKLKLQIEDIVNLALETCFPSEFEFHLDFKISRGKTEARFVYLSQTSGRETDPMCASGGGVVDIVSFALRIACFAIEDGISDTIILDEPFKFLSRDLREKSGLLLKTLSEKLNIQIIMVTHVNELEDCSDSIFMTKKDSDGISHTEIK